MWKGLNDETILNCVKMYTAKNSRELKKLLEEEKSPICVIDSKTKKVVEILESLKQKGVKETAKDEIKKTIMEILNPTMNVVSEVTIIVIVGMSLAAIVSLYAIYKGKNIVLKYKKDGSIELSTEN